MDWKAAWKKFWHFIWEDDSIWSWLANVVLAFVIIKFLVYPGLGLALQTSHPIVAVISESMEHDGSFDEWWMSPAACGRERCEQKDFYAAYNISKDTFEEYPWRNGINKGDIMVLYGKDPAKIEPGEVLVFNVGQPVPIIHRIIDKWTEDGDYYFTTKGDHNPALFEQIGEARIHEDQVMGKAVFRIPFLGYVKIWFVDLLQLVGLA